MAIGRLAPLIGVAALGLAACASADPPILAAPAGQTFHVVPAGAAKPAADFQHYAEMVAGGLEARGLRRAASRETSDLLVRLDYDVRQDLAEQRPLWRTSGRRYGAGSSGPYADEGPFASGFVSTGAPGNNHRAYTVTEIRWRVEIVRQADMVSLFEGTLDRNGWRRIASR